MKKNLKVIGIICIIFVLFVIAGMYKFNYLSGKSGYDVDGNKMVLSDYKNTSYTIDGQIVKLVDGISEVESAPGSASKIITKYFGNEIKKDLNGDGKDDIAFLVTQENGGSGTFFYVVAALNTSNGYIGSHGVLLGDRISPQTTESGKGNSIIVNYMDRVFGEPMTTSPSVGKSIKLILDPTTMQFGELAQNFEGEADPKRMSLNMKTWKWVKAESSDGEIVVPKKDSFTLTFKKDGTFGTTTDCNIAGGKYDLKDNTIVFSNIFSTKMYCEDSQENYFISLLDKTNGYLFTSKGELVLTLKSDSGSVYFK